MSGTRYEESYGTLVLLVANLPWTVAKVANLRLADELLAPAVTGALAKLSFADEDAGAVKLALQYAAAIDRAENRAEALERLGPKLLACLDALGATPAARARLKGGPADAATNRLALLREARRAN